MAEERKACARCRTTRAWSSRFASAIRKCSSARKASSCARRSRLAWVSTSPTCASSLTSICRKSVEGYYQETGRAGRDGMPANAWMAYGLGDVVQQRKMIDESDADDAHKRVQTGKLDALLGLCERPRHAVVCACSTYFGEASEPCGNCDTCLEPPDTWDATREAQMALSCVFRAQRASGFHFGAGHLIDILRGNRSREDPATRPREVDHLWHRGGAGANRNGAPFFVSWWPSVI